MQIQSHLTDFNTVQNIDGNLHNANVSQEYKARLSASEQTAKYTLLLFNKNNFFFINGEKFFPLSPSPQIVHRDIPLIFALIFLKH